MHVAVSTIDTLLLAALTTYAVWLAWSTVTANGVPPTGTCGGVCVHPEVTWLLQVGDRSRSGGVIAPPQGLCLLGVDYGE